jgi:hypothetical protein
MRTEFAWMVALNADHYNINQIPDKQYDLGIVIIPKKNPDFDINNYRHHDNSNSGQNEPPGKIYGRLYQK